ncbi:phosphoribosyltransferase-like protein [Pedobacter sp. CFBP9032]|uniref:phosphoribosyltransferase-like protein n=1 Tax=Pedobacter sp. CFBP9032 TaxID=3096539 RepID=UPI002A6B0DF8|nr:hypothetical protein [Pedobacter sp. CFBP9032]MDY0903892.1 hypothetical protein [Pedobacter sp. CFBP9032]
MNALETLPIYDRLLKKIYAYYQTIWRDKFKDDIHQDWLNNFHHSDTDLSEKEKLNMLYLLSKFMYFGNEELRQLLLSVFRDLYKYPIISQIRKANNDTIDQNFIDIEFKKELEKTRFLGVGNPSESGVHLLYYFRQQCGLSKRSFINTSDIFTTLPIIEKDNHGNDRKFLKSEINHKDVKRYIFIDDFCGSGQQATLYLKNTAENMKFEDPDIEISYLMLFSTEVGLNEVRKIKALDVVEAIFTIDDTFKAFSTQSRYFTSTVDKDIDKAFSKTTATKYGSPLFHPALGHGDCQLLFGLFHNTPDNTLPIFWSETKDWKAIFKRYNKIY